MYLFIGVLVLLLLASAGVIAYLAARGNCDGETRSAAGDSKPVRASSAGVSSAGVAGITIAGVVGAPLLLLLTLGTLRITRRGPYREPVTVAAMTENLLDPEKAARLARLLQEEQDAAYLTYEPLPPSASGSLKRRRSS